MYTKPCSWGGAILANCRFLDIGANQQQTASDYDLRYLRIQDKTTASDFANLYSYIRVSHRTALPIRLLELKIIDCEQAL